MDFLLNGQMSTQILDYAPKEMSQNLSDNKSIRLLTHSGHVNVVPMSGREYGAGLGAQRLPAVSYS